MIDLKEINFWTRLEAFMKDVEVNDEPSKEEKEMILYICKIEKDKK